MKLFPFVIFAAAAFGGSLQEKELHARLQKLTDGFDGRVGICVQNVCVRGDDKFPMQSVMKLIAVIAALDRGWRLDEPVVVRREDLSLYVQPIAKLVTKEGFHTTLGDLMRRAIVDSDSAAVDILVARLGGPAEVQAYLTRNRLDGVRFDRDEKRLQTEIAGITWRPEYLAPEKLEAAIAAVPADRRTLAFQKYLRDARDTSTPQGMSSLLQRLAAGQMLSVENTKFVLRTMAQTVTFPDRLKAGIGPGWTIAHKTGTSGSWQGITAATNDVGILTAPDGKAISVVVFIADCRAPEAKRAELMANVTRAAIANYR